MATRISGKQITKNVTSDNLLFCLLAMINHIIHHDLLSFSPRFNKPLLQLVHTSDYFVISQRSNSEHVLRQWKNKPNFMLCDLVQ